MTAATPAWVPDGKDLEVIVTLLQLAAIELTPSPGTRFTFEELCSVARAGGEVLLDERDVRIVLGSVKFLKKEPGAMYSLR